MSEFLSVMLLIVVVFAVVLVRERWRARALDAWCRDRGFSSPQKVVPGERPPLDRLVKRFDPRAGRIWGSGTSGTWAGVDLTFAEHETSPPGKKTGVWQTALVWPADDPGGVLVLWPRAGGQVAEAIGALVRGTNVGVAVAADTEAASTATRVRTSGDLVVDGDAGVRQAWLTDARRAALEAWPHGGAFALDGGYAVWRVEGLLPPARMDELARQAMEARRLMGCV